MTSSSVTTDVSVLLHAACRRRDLTVCDVARLCDITSEFMCDIVAGKRPPTPEAVERMTRVLQLNHREAGVLLKAAGAGPTPGFEAVHRSGLD